LIVVAIVGIMAVYAIPSFQRAMYESQVSSRATALTADLRLAKSEAVRRGADVTLKVGADNGWDVCVGNSAACTAATTLREHEGSSKVNITSALPKTTIIYGARGRTTTATRMKVAHSNDATVYRCIDVLATGALEVLRPTQGSPACS
jgi:type IV fimbrial biogenesis protein FimT